MKEFILNLIRTNTEESTMRLIFLFMSLIIGMSVLSINIGILINIAKYSGAEITMMIGADCTLLISILYGKNKSKEIESK